MLDIVKEISKIHQEIDRLFITLLESETRKKRFHIKHLIIKAEKRKADLMRKAGFNTDEYLDYLEREERDMGDIISEYCSKLLQMMGLKTTGL